jgi:hypothetical protein
MARQCRAPALSSDFRNPSLAYRRWTMRTTTPKWQKKKKEDVVNCAQENPPEQGAPHPSPRTCSGGNDTAAAAEIQAAASATASKRGPPASAIGTGEGGEGYATNSWGGEIREVGAALSQVPWGWSVVSRRGVVAADLVAADDDDGGRGRRVLCLCLLGMLRRAWHG